MTGTFEFDGNEVQLGTTEHFRFEITETYLGDPIEIPVSIVNGNETGKTVFLTAAIHGDELNGIEVVRSVARDWDNSDLKGTLICLPVINVPGFQRQERYLPVQDRDLNRAFPGKGSGISSSRIALKIWETFIQKCDMGIDFHTSTRGRTNMFHVRGDLDNKRVERLARAFGANIILDGEGSEGTLRRESTQAGIPTITVEMGQAHRFEREQIERALEGIKSVFAEYGMYETETVNWPGWTEIIEGWDEKTWIRADSGGLVEFKCNVGDLIEEGDPICVISSPFENEKTIVEAPFTGLAVGLLRNPVVYPGNPICHFVKPQEKTVEIINMIEEGEEGSLI